MSDECDVCGQAVIDCRRCKHNDHCPGFESCDYLNKRLVTFVSGGKPTSMVIDITLLPTHLAGLKRAGAEAVQVWRLTQDELCL